MNAMHRLSVSALTLTAACLLGAAPAAMAADCASPQGVGAARACAAASQGATELRRFIGRTEGIYILTFQDFVSNLPSRDKVADAAPATPAAPQQVALK
jgi:hypothetical protein